MKGQPKPETGQRSVFVSSGTRTQVENYRGGRERRVPSLDGQLVRNMNKSFNITEVI